MERYKKAQSINTDYELIPKEKDEGLRLDLYLSEQIEDLSRSKAKMLINNNSVMVNDNWVKASYSITSGDVVKVDTQLIQSEITLIPQSIPLDIVYEDEYLLVVNKPRNMVVHPGAGNYRDTMVNALLYHCQNLSDGTSYERPGIVHRLDKDTSGLLVVAKQNETHDILSEEIKNRRVARTYLALVIGDFSKKKATIDLPIGRDPRNRKKMAVVHGGKRAITKVEMLRSFQNPEKISYLKCSLETGRTHQIRVHLSHLGYPLLGDPVYRGKTGKNVDIDKNLTGQALHSFSLAFTHPVFKKTMVFRAPLPSDMMNLISKLTRSDKTNFR
ncbi:RluA family pseudouridine synthase [Natranaerobius thermophilus]|uniref:Pseudouridine synthase n=1 Tax=Natranaerobius thermophilus (strain ATCC BAA-1301 / DSM 18059 / JW/NM-WN-LF) TaxID=457570 RepID=B2A2J2_NATTJ|nr:RluA family pseudouridine synthase [Natranaerobius thermophilus]ACB84907.1 pseudouridine synthase, RluA family [Natranaerobius thermophilus JW/NM-WN-LF]